jgi:hypothetical protein
MLQNALVAVFALDLLGGSAARADIIVAVGSSGAFSPSTGNTVEVDLTNTGPGSVVIGGFSLEVTTADPFITFTGASMGTANPYIFAGNSGDVADSFPLAFSSPGQTLDAGDFYATFGAGTSLLAGESAGLALLSFDVAPGDPNTTVLFNVTAYPSTSLSDADGNDVPIDTVTSGTITVTISGVSAVPEPGTFLLLLPLAVLTMLVRRRRCEG